MSLTATPAAPTTVAARPHPLGAVALAAAGVLFLLYPVTRPWHDETTASGAQASFGSGWWVASHLFAMIGFVLLPAGLLALRAAAPGRAATVAVAAAWLGAGLTLPYYGAEDFALHAAAGRDLDLLGFAEAVRYGAAAVTTFAAGLLLLAVAGVAAGLAVARSGRMPRAAGLPFALGLLLFLPQFFTPAPVRIAHGVLLAAGCLWLALALRRAAA